MLLLFIFLNGCNQAVPTENTALENLLGVSLNDEKKEVAVIGLGNPFYIHAQHINYEDSNEFGSYIDNAKFNAVIPIGIDASYVVLASQDAFGFDDINEISLEKSLINNQ